METRLTPNWMLGQTAREKRVALREKFKKYQRITSWGIRIGKVILRRGKADSTRGVSLHRGRGRASGGLKCKASPSRGRVGFPVRPRKGIGAYKKNSWTATDARYAEHHPEESVILEKARGRAGTEETDDGGHHFRRQRAPSEV